MDLKKICSQQHYTRSLYYLNFADLYIAREDLESAGYDTEFLSDEDIQYIADLTKERLETMYDEEDLQGDDKFDIMFDALYDVLHDTMKNISDSINETVILQTDDITMISYGDTVDEANLNANNFLNAIKTDSFFHDIQEEAKELEESQIKILDSVIRVVDKKVYVSKEDVEQFLKRFTDKYFSVQSIIYKDELNLELSETNKRKMESGDYVPQIQTEKFDKESTMTPTILGLEADDYVEGPVESLDKNKRVQELAKDFYVFGKDVNGESVYIKISEGIGDKPFVFSFHETQYPLRYKFKK